MNDEDDIRSGLSEGARRVYDKINLRKHGVNLERVQRIHQGIDTEDMEFSAATIAQMLQEVADECDENDAFTIHAVVNALLGRDDHHRLVLKQKRPGKYVNPTAHEATHNRHQYWLHWLAGREDAGIKTEAAIAEIAASENVSRAAVFQGIRQAEEFLDRGRKIFEGNENFENPRPAKKQNT